jgi:CDP-2,3-bis-(O-geranylgeranyl)-sn-glycerol synthase
MTLEATLVGALWLMAPAYLANPAAQITGGGLRMDLGRNARDGRPLLGPGKTWRGLAGGCLGGLAIGSLQVAGASLAGSTSLSFDPSGGPASPASFLVVFALALGALLGDATKSYAKRRLGLERGARLPLGDQYDFVLGAWVVTFALFPAWFAASFPWEAVAFILLITFALHRGVSRLGYRMGLKAEPW